MDKILDLALKLKKELTEDILQRYFHAGYFDSGVVDNFFVNNEVSDEERAKVLKIVNTLCGG